MSKLTDIAAHICFVFNYSYKVPDILNIYILGFVIFG